MGFRDRHRQNRTPTTEPTPAPSGGVSPGMQATGTTAYGAAALGGILDELASAQEGTRNAALNDASFAAAQLADGGHLQWATVVEDLAACARSLGLEDREIRRTIQSAREGAGRNPRRDMPDPNEDPGPPPGGFVLGDQPGADHKGFWDEREVLAHIRDFARARRVSPWALLGITLAQIVTRTPPHVVLPPLVGGKASLNLFVGIVGPSGAGKGGSENAARELIDNPREITTLPLGSGEAIAHSFMRRQKNDEGHLEVVQYREALLFSVPEIDTLTALAARGGGDSTVLPELRKAWMGEQLGFNYVDPLKRLPVPPHAYRLCLIAGIQPGRAKALLRDAEGGTPQRFVWLPAVDPDAPDVAPADPGPWAWEVPGLRDLITPSGTYMGVCETARVEIDQNRLARLRGGQPTIDGHGDLARLKVGAALALLDERTDVTEEDWSLAGTVMGMSMRTREYVRSTLDAEESRANKARGQADAERALIVRESEEQATFRKVRRAILKRLDRFGSEGVGEGRLRADVATGSDRGVVAEALATLVDEGLVEVVEGPRGSRYTRA